MTRARANNWQKSADENGQIRQSNTARTVGNVGSHPPSRIWASSQFRKRLPSTSVQGSSGESRLSRPRGGAVMSRRILVVEDQEDNRRILRDLLTSAGYEIIQAENGEEALAAAARERPDLILMDIQLPVLDGYEATRRIKANPALRAIPVLAVTSYALSGDENKARPAGADADVTKPFSPRALLAKIREYVP